MNRKKLRSLSNIRIESGNFSFKYFFTRQVFVIHQLILSYTLVANNFINLFIWNKTNRRDNLWGDFIILNLFQFKRIPYEKSINKSYFI